jgi:hypothetical protein
VGIVSGIAQLPVSHPRTWQVPKSKNHIPSGVPDIVADSDTSGYPQCSILDIPPRHQPQQKEEVVLPVNPMDLQQQDPEVKQVALDEFESMQEPLIHMRKGTPASAPDKVAIVSNPTFA